MTNKNYDNYCLVDGTNKDSKSGKFGKLGLEIGKMVDIKNEQYGNSFFESGEIIKVLYPNGITPDQYQDMLSIVRIIDKLFRIAEGCKGDESPARDIAGYGILMTHSHENIFKNNKSRIK